MFSQFRHAVETFAQPVRRSSQDLTDEDRQHSRSLDQGLRQSLSLPSGQLAESAVETLRKSLTAQRAGAGATSPPPAAQPSRRRPNLEERLKATFTIGDVSNDPSPSPGTRVSTPIPVSNHPLSPGSTPLPDSPAVSPRSSVDIHSNDTTAVSPSSGETSSATLVPETALSTSTLVKTQHDDRLPEADVPLPSVLDDAQSTHRGSEEVTPVEVQEATPAEVAQVTAVVEQSDDSSLAIIEHPSADTAQAGSLPSSEAFSTEDGVGFMQERLKLVEQRFADVSISFKRLQAEKLTVDRLLKEFTPLESIQDTEALRDYLQNNRSQVEIAQAEINRLNGSISRQEERLQELRDTHRLESASQLELIDQLREQLTETDALLKASQNSSSTLEEDLVSRKGEITQLQAEIEKIKTSVKDEEEKRVKAVSLLKTVRQKLVKAEKDKEDAVREAAQVQAKEREERDKAEAEKKKLRDEIGEVNADRERALNGLKTQFDREIALLKDRQEKESAALRGQFELETATAKSLHEQELHRTSTTISSLENLVQILRSEKDDFFEQLEMRQAKVESSQSRLEVLQNQNIEYQYQFRELNERIGLLNEELAEARRDQETRARGAFTSTEEVAQLLSSTEARYEARIADLRRTVASLERERDESEADWSKKLREKSKEIEDLRRVFDSSSRSRDETDSFVDDLKAEMSRLKKDIASYQKQIADYQMASEKTKESEDMERQRIAEMQTQISLLQKSLEEAKGREAQLRFSNKTLREELRKVQSSAALLERQRNPGIGYWSSRPEEGRRSTSSLTEGNGSRPSSPSVPTDDEEVNLEYLRNVILQFLEHKEMRPQLVKVLSTILRFTPQETRRLVAKV